MEGDTIIVSLSWQNNTDELALRLSECLIADENNSLHDTILREKWCRTEANGSESSNKLRQKVPRPY